MVQPCRSELVKGAASDPPDDISERIWPHCEGALVGAPLEVRCSLLSQDQHIDNRIALGDMKSPC
jgi:hypothetical protein